MATVKVPRRAPSQNVIDISTEILTLANTARTAAYQVVTAKNAHTALANSFETNIRLKLYAKAAETSLANRWDASDVDEACDHARKVMLGNTKDDAAIKTLGVLCSELKVFASPSVRKVYDLILSACETAWQTEEEDEPEAQKPVHKWRNRFQKVVLGICIAIKNGKLTVHAPEDVTRWAVMNDPDFDADKIALRLHNLYKTLDNIAKDFGDPRIALMDEYLKTITPEQLADARRALLARKADEENARTAAYRLAPIPPHLQKPAEKPAETETASDDIIQGAYDINMEEMLGETTLA
jgi:hypothetical protein